MKVSHIIWNLVGLGFPLIIAVITIPHLLAVIGLERFGFLTLAWALIGYASIFDLGVGRAVTHYVSVKLGAKDVQLIPAIVNTAVVFTSLLGSLAFLLICLSVYLGVEQWIPKQQVSSSEINHSLLLLALAIPLQAMSATYKGLNEAFLSFRGISILRVFLGVANFGGPFLIAAYSHSMPLLVSSLVLSRLIAFFVYRYLAKSNLVQLGVTKGASFATEHLKRLFEFSSWVTLSSIISPFLVQADRFFIGLMLTASAVTLYVIPYEITVQALIGVGAISSVAFPAISRLLASQPQQAKALFQRWLVIVSVMMFVAMVGIAMLMPIILSIWVGGYVDQTSVWVGQILCLGVFLNAIGVMYYAWLHANGDTKYTALCHCAELPLFAMLLYFLVGEFGIVGAAIAWVFRVALDCALLIYRYLSMPTTEAESSGASDVA
ncbi:flippase [Agarivorans sp. MS3-6]|uniref:flippase n=1 Tax=Agarivorans sp. TSD2052 TaxID=2937286 RepID=UPI00200FE3F1|nr:flippase [Agarivorans sp. TSD2052]UPW20093.1 flippase [Agarivorans sp. TSD2052]